MVVYADTSFLFSLYSQDANSTEAARIMTDLGVALVFTPLQQHELRNAFRLSVFRREISAGDCRQLLDTIEHDSDSGVLMDLPVPWSESWRNFETLSSDHTPATGTRGFDVLHVAIAMAVGCRRFLTFDTRQARLASLSGLEISPPQK